MNIKKIEAVISSYPKCGKTWFIYCFEFLSERPSESLARPDCKILERINPESAETKGKDPIVGYSHKVSHLENYKEKHLICLIRDYKECISTFTSKTNLMGTYKSGSYLENLELFHNWKSDKTLIYYEDLLSNPRLVLQSIVDSFNLDQNRLELFLDNYEEHRSKSLAAYPKKTDGESLNFYSKCMSSDHITHWDNEMERSNPKLYELYLTRYKK